MQVLKVSGKINSESRILILLNYHKMVEGGLHFINPEYINNKGKTINKIKK